MTNTLQARTAHATPGTEHIVLAGPNDSNGNPRRVSVLIRRGVIIAASDHGHYGAPRDWFGGVQFPVLVGCYRDHLMCARASGYLYDPEVAPAPADIPDKPDQPGAEEVQP